MKGLISYEQFTDPAKARQIVDTMTCRLQDRQDKNYRIELVERIYPGIEKNLMTIDTMFPEYLRESYQELTEKLTCKDNACLITSRTGNSLTGFLLGYHSHEFSQDSYFADILAVHETYQSKGIATHLVQTGILLLDLLSYKDVFLYCEKQNTEGVNLVHLYRKQGFHVVGLRDGGILMRRTIR